VQRENYLLSAIRGQIEDEHRQEGNSHAGNDEVHRVEKRLSAHGDVERDIQVRLVAARVELLVPALRHTQKSAFLFSRAPSLT
jgi:hypothetical protein